jgi:hypothetical protein
MIAATRRPVYPGDFVDAWLLAKVHAPDVTAFLPRRFRRTSHLTVRDSHRGGMGSEPQWAHQSGPIGAGPGN